MRGQHWNANPKRKRGRKLVVPRSRFGLVKPLSMAPRLVGTIARQTVLACALCLLASTPSARAVALSDTIAQVQPKVVKIYGAGGFQGLEAYQSGMLISAEGHVLTVWSYVLDTDEVLVTLDDGRRFKAEVLGADPRLDLAVLKIDAVELPHFELAAAAAADPGAACWLSAICSAWRPATSR